MNAPDAEAAIVVGIPPGGRVSDGTVSFVLDTAADLDVGVELVHVVPMIAGRATGAWETGVILDQLVAAGRSGLALALARFRAQAPLVPVQSTLLRGGVVDNLVEHGRYAQLVVLEHRRRGRWAGLTAGSITCGVAARAHVPVVSVPAAWHGRRMPRPITVGVEDAQRAQSEIWTALGLAAASGLPVRLLRIAWLSEAYQELMRREVDVDDLLARARRDLERDARLPSSVVEQVPCTYEVVWGKPAEVLVKAGAGSSMLVLARRDPVLPFGSHLGGVVRQVLSAADCPVMVVEPSLNQPVSLVDAPVPGAVEVAG